MNEMELLTKKVHEAVKQLKSLKKERDELAVELNLLREENRKARKTLQRNESLLNERTRIKDRLERLRNKLSELSI